MRAKLDEWQAWLDGETDRLLALDERAKMSGTDADRGDVAAAFVARKAIGDRLAAIAPLIDKHRREAVALMGKPVLDSMGGSVGKDIDDAAKLLDAIIGAVEQRLDTTEQRHEVDIAKAQAIDADLAVAERLSRQLGEQVNQVAQLRQQQAARRRPRRRRGDGGEGARRAGAQRPGAPAGARRVQRRSRSHPTAGRARAQRARPRGALRREDRRPAAPRRAVRRGARWRARPGQAGRPALVGGARRRSSRSSTSSIASSGHWTRRLGASEPRSPSATTCAACSRASAARPGPTASPRIRPSSRCTARRATCCGRHRATSTGRARSSSGTSPR